MVEFIEQDANICSSASSTVTGAAAVTITGSKNRSGLDDSNGLDDR